MSSLHRYCSVARPFRNGTVYHRRPRSSFRPRPEFLENRCLLSVSDCLVSWWSAEGSAADVADGNDGLLMNGAGFAPGRSGQAFSLDGLDDYIHVDNASNLQVSGGDFSVETWVRFDSLTQPTPTYTINDMSIIDKMVGAGPPDAFGINANRDGWRLIKQTDDHFWFILGAGTFNGGTAGSAFTVRSTTEATIEQWYHLVVTKTASQFSLYVNGVKEQGMPTPAFVDTHSTNISIGRTLAEGSTGESSSHLNGQIDDARIYNCALTDVEVMARFNGVNAPAPTAVIIDIKPGSDPNSVNLSNEGVIGVSVLTADQFDASQIDISTAVFAGALAVHGTLEDVDNDGDTDMVLHFRTEDTNLDEIYRQLVADDIDADGVLDSNKQETEVSLTGATLADVLFEGSDDMNLFLSGKALRALLDALAADGLI